MWLEIPQDKRKKKHLNSLTFTIPTLPNLIYSLSLLKESVSLVPYKTVYPSGESWSIFLECPLNPGERKDDVWGLQMCVCMFGYMLRVCELCGCVSVYCVCESCVVVGCVYFVHACVGWVWVGTVWVWVCVSVWGLWVACSTFGWMFHSHPFYYDPGQTTFMPLTASWSTKHGAIHGMKLATKPSKRRNNSLAGCVHNMADWIWKQMPAAGIVLVTEKTWPLRNRRQGDSPLEPRGRGEEVKPMNKSGHENWGEKKMLTRTFYGEKGAVQYAIAPAPRLAEHFLGQWLFNRWETQWKKPTFAQWRIPVCLVCCWAGVWRKAIQQVRGFGASLIQSSQDVRGDWF